ncbi:MAG: glycosyltransferase family 1 protein [Gammaproteobacteria bacterium]|nr:glycosyltransferase family 1 protein [Gammaproteobacteria bacterium]
MKRKPRVLFVVTEDWYFWSHRLGLARNARDAGYEVVLIARYSAYRAQIEAENIRCIALPFERSLRHPGRDLHCLIALAKLIRAERPTIVHLVALKPILLSALAVLTAPHVSFIHAVTGLGYLFTAEGAPARGMRVLVLCLLRWLLGRRNSSLLVQNDDDLQELRKHGVGDLARTRLIAGVGVDTLQFSPAYAEEEQIPLVILPARLLRDKGICEFLDAAKRILRRGVNVRFALVGALDLDNPAALRTEELKAMLLPGIEWWGIRADMASIYRRAAIVCLPSYREGLPKVLLEAAACGRPLIATDVPGCREICRNNSTGLLVPLRNSEALEQAIVQLLADPLRRRDFGVRARSIIEAEFSLAMIAKQTLDFYGELHGVESGI